MPVALVRHEAGREVALGLDHPCPAPELARAGGHVIAHLVAVADQRQVHPEVFERVVAGVAHQLFHRVRAVRCRASAHGGLVHLQKDPVFAVGPHAGIGREAEGRGVARRHLVRNDRGQRLDHEIGHALNLAEPRLRRRWRDGVEDAPFGRNHADGAEGPFVRRDIVGRGVGIQQHRPEDEEGRHLGRAVEGHVEGRRHLRGGAGQVDLGTVALDPHADLDRQGLVAVAAIVVEEAFGEIFAVRYLLDLRPHPAFGVVHQLLGRLDNGVLAVFPDQLLEAAHAQFGRRDLRLQIPHHEAWDPRVVADVFPQVLVALALVVELHAVKQHALGPDIRHVDDQAGRGRPDVHMMRGIGREADEFAIIEDRHHDGDVGRMRGALVGVIVDHAVAGLPVFQLHRLFDPAQVAGQRADVHRCGVGFAQSVVFGVEQPRAKVLAFADDRGIAHAVEHVAHLLGDGMQRPADDLKGDRVEFLGHVMPPYTRSMRISPWPRTVAANFGGTMVVELCCVMIAGPWIVSSASSFSRS